MDQGWYPVQSQRDALGNLVHCPPWRWWLKTFSQSSNPPLVPTLSSQIAAKIQRLDHDVLLVSPTLLKQRQRVTTCNRQDFI
jgi:hypothetical protein